MPDCEEPLPDPGAEPLAPLRVPRLFWPVALSLAGLMAAVLLVEPLEGMFTRGATNYNEGWNSYHQQEAEQGKPLYGARPGWVSTNYPPISFHLVGLASRLTGDVNQTGRWVALLSLALVAMLCGAIVRCLTGSTPLAAYTAFSVVIWLAVYKADRIGSNDPQLLGTAFSLVGLYAHFRDRERPLWLYASAIAFTVSVFTKHNLLAFPAAVGLHLILCGRWRDLRTWIGAIAGGSALLLLLTRWIDGPYFFAHILAPRAHSPGWWMISDYLMLFQVPIALAVFWSLRHRGRSSDAMVLALIAAHALALAFAGGDGVDKNIFFDCILALAVVGALAFAEYAPLLSMAYRGFPLAALLVAPIFGAVIKMPETLRWDLGMWRALPNRETDFDYAVGLVQNRPGPALCEDLLVCFEAGKPFLYDAYFANAMVKAGRLKEEELVALVEKASFRTVELDFPLEQERLMEPHDRRFTAGFLDALREHYHQEIRLYGWVILVPNE
jgi:hypothetical protein